MDKLSAESLAEMVKCCVGLINSYGDTEYDSVTRENVNKFLAVLDILLKHAHGLMDNVDSDDTDEMINSCRVVGFLAEQRDNIDKWLKESKDKMLNGN